MTASASDAVHSIRQYQGGVCIVPFQVPNTSAINILNLLAEWHRLPESRLTAAMEKSPTRAVLGGHAENIFSTYSCCMYCAGCVCVGLGQLVQYRPIVVGCSCRWQACRSFLYLDPDQWRFSCMCSIWTETCTVPFCMYLHLDVLYSPASTPLPPSPRSCHHCHHDAAHPIGSLELTLFTEYPAWWLRGGAARIVLFPAAQAVAVAGWQQVDWAAGISICPCGDVVVVLCCASSVVPGCTAVFLAARISHLICLNLCICVFVLRAVCVFFYMYMCVGMCI